MKHLEAIQEMPDLSKSFAGTLSTPRNEKTSFFNREDKIAMKHF